MTHLGQANLLILGGYYKSDESIDEDLNSLLLKIFNSYDNMNFFLKKVKKYNPVGRLQTENESNKISDELCNLLGRLKLDYEVENSDLEGGNRIINKIVNYIGKKKDIGDK